MKLGLSVSDAVTQIENGQADWSYDAPPADRLGEIGDKYKDQFHINPVPQNYHMAINTRVAPFDKLEVRQALNFATDRNAVLQLWGGKALGKISCQILPFNFPGHEPYCPYTKNPGTTWTAPDMAKAQQLVDQSGTKGQKVTIISTPDETTKAINLYFVSLLRKLGYKASIKTLNSLGPVLLRAGLEQQGAAVVLVLVSRLHLGVELHDDGGGLRRLPPAQHVEPEPLRVLRPGDPEEDRAGAKLAQTDQDAANKLWAEVDKDTTDQAPLVTLFIANRLDFVSKRLGNFQFNGSVTGNFMIDQAWVQ